jgi:hypothetical protein
MTEYALGDVRCRGLARPVYQFLMRMIPTAVYLARTGRNRGDESNPFASLRPGNLWSCYRRSWASRLAAMALRFAAGWTPLPLLGAALRRVSRHPR